MLRIKISLDQDNGQSHLTRNYAPVLAEQVAKILKETDQFFGLYCIGNLSFDKVEKAGEKLVHTGKSADFILSIYDFSLTADDLLGFFEDKLFFLPQAYKVVYLKILELPLFKRVMNYEVLSPISVSQVREIDGNTAYFFPGDILFADLFFERLYNLHVLSGGQKLDVSACRYFQDSTLVKEKFSFNKGNKTRNIKAFRQDFTVVAPPEIQKVLFFAGAGKLTEEGFGCVGVVEKYKKHE